jgi:hypothetical protein
MLVEVENGAFLVFGSRAGAVDGDDTVVGDGDVHGDSFLLYQ